MGFAAAHAPDHFSTISPAIDAGVQRSSQGLPAPSAPAQSAPDSTSSDSTWNPHAPGAAAAAAVAARLTAMAAAGELIRLAAIVKGKLKLALCPSCAVTDP